MAILEKLSRMGKAESFKVLHITDTHYAKHPGCLTWPSVFPWVYGWRKALFLFLSKRASPSWLTSHDVEADRALMHTIMTTKANYKLILLTGDIATSSKNEDLALAHQRIKTWRAKDKIFLLPGNHDQYNMPRRWVIKKPSSDAFDREFQLSGQNAWSFGQIKRLWSTKEPFAVSIVAANLVLDGFDWTFFDYPGRGTVLPSDLSVLRELTIEESKTHSVIWALHFNPMQSTPFANESETKKHRNYGLTLKNSAKLLELANELRVSGIVCGHTHMFLRRTSGSVPVLIGGTPCEVGSNNNINPFGEWSIQELTISNGGAGSISVTSKKLMYQDNAAQGSRKYPCFR